MLQQVTETFVNLHLDSLAYMLNTLLTYIKITNKGIYLLITY